MPIAATYPGVYIEEIPSGVRTITGVSTSVTAFVGSAKRGPIDRAVRVLGFADYERRFGGLTKTSEMSYAVRQFFSNGGSEAWIVRVAASSTFAKAILKKGPANVLRVTAFDAGSSGGKIRLYVDTKTSNPASTFNLTVVYADPNDSSGTVTETFANLSMNSKDPRYVKTVINGQSALVTVEREDTTAVPLVTVAGKARSGPLLNADLGGVDASHNQFRISASGSEPVPITITLPGDVADLATLATKLTTKINAAGNTAGVPALAGTTVTTVADGAATRLVFTAGGAATDEASSVRLLPGLQNDVSVRLKLGTLNGGDETDGAAAMRPDAVPLAGVLTGKDILNTALAALPDATHNTFLISVDGGPPQSVTMSGGAIPSAQLFADTLQGLIRNLNMASEAYRNLTVRVDPKTGDPTMSHLVISSGTRGSGSSIAVYAAAANDLAGPLGLLTGSTGVTGDDVRLQGGTETDFNPANPFATVIASRAARKGLYALEAVDIFNILCIPGVSNGPTLAEAAAYCQERRAFLIVDPPSGLEPDQMETAIKGPELPKTNHAAIYYPWLKVGDPLSGGALRTVAPSGTIAGLYARTDATRGVWKAPAGTEATLVGVQAVEYVLTDRENGILNPRGVNCNRVLPVYGAVSWGARTMQGDDGFASEWKYVPVRRLALFLEESLYRGTQWVVFEPNDEPLWAQIRLNIGAFLQNLFRQGAFQGRSPREAYLVKCDRETTTQTDINMGVVNIIVGFAPLKPAEFVFIKIQQLAGQIQT